MLLKSFRLGWLATNCYLVAREAGGEALIVDPGEGAAPLLGQMLGEHRLIPRAVLLTHGHLDHMWSARRICDRFGIPAYIHRDDRPMLTDPLMGVGSWITRRLARAWFTEPKRVVEVTDGASLQLAEFAVAVLHTPGHTPGSVAFEITPGPDARARAVFTGDTLFDGAVGRTDLGDGSEADLRRSITTKLLVLEDDTVVLPGHGRQTTIGLERRTNPFLGASTYPDNPDKGTCARRVSGG